MYMCIYLMCVCVCVRESVCGRMSREMWHSARARAHDEPRDTQREGTQGRVRNRE